MAQTEATDVSLGGETAKATLAKFTMAAAGFVGTIIFARLLGPVGIGGYYLLFTVVGLSNRPIGGLAATVQKRLSQTEFPAGEALSIATVAAVAWTVLCTAIAVLLSDALDAFVGFDQAWMPFGALLAGLNLFLIYQGALSATGRIGRSRWIDAARSYLTLPLQLALVWVGLGAAGMVYGEALATALLLVPLFYAGSGHFSRPSWQTVKSIWSYAKYSIPNRYLSRAYAELDILILGALLTEAAAGNYGVAFRLSVPAMFIAMVASSGLLSRVSNRRSRDEPVEEDIENTLSFTSLFAIPMFFGGVVLGKELVVTLYGPEFASAAILLVGLLLYQAIRSQASPLEKIVEGFDNPELVTRVYALIVVLNVALGIALTLFIGAIGVVLATVVVEALRYGSLAVYVRRSVSTASLVPLAIVTQILSGVVMAAILYLLRPMVTVNSWIPLSLLVGLGGGIYFLTLFATSRRFRQTLFGTLDDVYPPWRERVGFK